MVTKSRFVGRERELTILADEYAEVARSGRGRLLVIRGRRRVGKSRLVEEFLDRRTPPSVFFAAARARSPERELGRFAEVVGRSVTTGVRLPPGTRFDSWTAALTAVSATAGPEAPVVVVLDEFPYLLEGDVGLEGELQAVWDRQLKDMPVLIIVVGSDVAVMETLTTYGRPLYDRPSRVLVINTLTPRELGSMLELDARGALETYLVLGGFPVLADTWRASDSVGRFLARELGDPTSPMVVSGERAMNAEFAPHTQARKVLSAIGAGERTFTGIGRGSGVPVPTLQVTLPMLLEKRVVERRVPLSTKPSREARYLIADPYLRFWLRFIEPGFEEIERGRGDLVAGRINAAWPEYRGKAIEPVVQEALRRRPADPQMANVALIGGYWTRSNDPEIDIVGLSTPKAARVELVGTIKWHARQPLDDRDAEALLKASSKVPGVDPRTVTAGVSFTGFRTDRLDVRLGPEDLLD